MQSPTDQGGLHSGVMSMQTLPIVYPATVQVVVLGVVYCEPAIHNPTKQRDGSLEAQGLSLQLACKSMHFLAFCLHCFGLFQCAYHQAWPLHCVCSIAD